MWSDKRDSQPSPMVHLFSKIIPPTIFHCDKGIRQILIVLCNGVYPFPELGIKNDYNKKNYDEISLAFLSIK